MLAVVQRVTYSSVSIESSIVGQIDKGFTILLGVFKGDEEKDIHKIVSKLKDIRLFNDVNDKMNLSIQDIKGEALVISQFTLAASLKKGRRPSFDHAESPDKAEQLYDEFIELLTHHMPVKSGKFGADMQVRIDNDGPVTFLLDSKDL
jgi:D-aminoacyl-tRNA deacylase